MTFLQRQCRKRSLYLFLYLWLVMGPVQAKDQVVANVVAGKAPELTLPLAISRVLRDSPVLSVYPHYLRAAEAQSLQSGLRPSPELSLELENIAGNGELSGSNSAELTLALSQVIELGGKRRYRQDVSRIGSEVVQKDYDLARLDVLSGAANHYLDVVWAQALLQLAEQAHTWAQSAGLVAERRFKAGSISRAEVSQTRIEAMQTQLTVSEAKDNLQMMRVELAGQWGAEQVDFGDAKAELFDLATLPSFAQLRTYLDASPQLQRYLTLDRLRQAELNLALADSSRNLVVGFGVRHFEETNDQALTFGISVPLGINKRNQGEVAAARAKLQQLDSEKKVSKILLHNKLYSLYQKLQQSRRRTTLLKTQALPEAKQALTQMEKGYRSGRFSYLQLLETRRQRLSLEHELINAAISFHRALLTLEQLTGEAMTGRSQSIILRSPTETYSQQDLQQ